MSCCCFVSSCCCVRPCLIAVAIFLYVFLWDNPSATREDYHLRVDAVNTTYIPEALEACSRLYDENDCDFIYTGPLDYSDYCRPCCLAAHVCSFARQEARLGARLARPLVGLYSYIYDQFRTHPPQNQTCVGRVQTSIETNRWVDDNTSFWTILWLVGWGVAPIVLWLVFRFGVLPCWRFCCCCDDDANYDMDDTLLDEYDVDRLLEEGRQEGRGGARRRIHHPEEDEGLCRCWENNNNGHRRRGRNSNHRGRDTLPSIRRSGGGGTGSSMSAVGSMGGRRAVGEIEGEVGEESTSDESGDSQFSHDPFLIRIRLSRGGRGRGRSPVRSG